MSCALLVLILQPAEFARAATSCTRVVAGPSVTIAVGKSGIVRPEAPVDRVVLGNAENSQNAAPKPGAKAEGERDGQAGLLAAQQRPRVADIDVLVLGPREIYILGKTIGSTNVVLVDQAGLCTMLDVVVSIDTTVVQASLAELLPGESGIKVSAAADSLVLSGKVSDALAADRAVDIATAFAPRAGADRGGTGGGRVLNMLAVSAPQQVMLEVKVAEVAKTVLDQFGINFTHAYAAADGTMLRFLSGVFGGDSLVAGQLSGVTGAAVGAGAVGSASNSSSFGVVSSPYGNGSLGSNSTTVPVASGKSATSLGVTAQKKDGLVKVLAEPTVMAISGQEGSFLAGGKVYIPVVSGNGAGGTTITLEEKEFGVSLRFTPTVLGDGRINLKVNPEVSELNPQGIAITVPGVSGQSILPSFTTRRASTTVQLHDGQSFAIGGLMKSNVNANVSAFPFLGELPVIGVLFRSHNFQTDQSELVIVITPHLVKPLPADYPLPTDGYTPPSRGELYLDGRLEGEPGHVPPAGEKPGGAPAEGGFQVK
jgi:pilus assembly protein CpaC